MTLRHDGNGLQFKTPKQTFTTGNTGYQLPVIHQSFAGKFLVQDSITGREKVYESLNTWHYVDLVPSSNGTKTVTLETISGAIIYTYNSDTLTTMRLRIGSTDNVVVNMNHKGSFYWSDNNYYTPTSIAGREWVIQLPLVKHVPITMNLPIPAINIRAFAPTSAAPTVGR